MKAKELVLSISGGRKCQPEEQLCNDPQLGVSLAGLRNRQASIAGAEYVIGSRRIVDEVR